MPKPSGPNFDRAFERQERTGHHLPYISKSRVTSYQKNPYHYYLSYIQGLKEPETFYMRRGSEIHAVIETYYENVVEEYERSGGGVYTDLLRYLPDDVSTWAKYVQPYITNFLAFEYSRRDLCASADGLMSHFPPVAIEEEVWDWGDDDDVPLMGFSDVVLWADSVPQLADVSTSEGVVIIDHKTGKVPKPQYRDEGIYLELEYYAKLFGDRYEVNALAGYYPLKNELVVAELSEERRIEVDKLINELTTLGTDVENYPTNPNILCCWGKEPEKQSGYYKVCPCEFGTPQGPGPTFRDENKRPL